ncbi:MAG: zf-HC2 domain-containing protein [Candidatus Subteraquimicrobiales bacterium]|nr:zf-HC2 domain-containing protein [Candidatus Subteraquimicrobiales bacterium]
MQEEKHLSPETIEKYVKGELSGDEVVDAERHLAGCAKCKMKTDTLRSFSSLWSEWTAKAHGEAHRKADEKRLVTIRKLLSERNVQELMEKFTDLIKKGPVHLQKSLEAMSQNLNDLFRRTFSYPTPSFAPVFGQYPITVLSPFGKVRYPIVFEWQPYEGADKYVVSIEEANWSYGTTATKVEISPKELELTHGREYMWGLKIMSGEKVIEEITGFFSFATEDEITELTEIEEQLKGIEPEQDKFVLWGGIFEEKEFYMEAVEEYKKAYQIEPVEGIAYRIANCYDRLELEELRDEWNRKILEKDLEK